MTKTELINQITTMLYSMNCNTLEGLTQKMLSLSNEERCTLIGSLLTETDSHKIL